MEEIIQQIITDFIANHQYKCCISTSILLHELFPEMALKCGYLICNGKYGVWHMWNEINGNIIDIASKITELQGTKIQKFEGTHLPPNSLANFLANAPRNYLVCDRNERIVLSILYEEFIENNENVLASYLTNKKQYWTRMKIEAPFCYRICSKYLPQLQKQGRNEACVCGSGKKYKKCCLIV